jgi:hypothetical protein
LKSPLRTINAAIDLVGPDDVIVVRGGTYRCVRAINLDRSGEQGRPIVLKAYASETPILDFSSVPEVPITITGAYWHLKGLIIAKGDRYGIRISGKNAHHNVLEQLIAYDNSYAGIGVERDAACNIVLSCDSYNNLDYTSNGGDSDGFGVYWTVGRNNVVIGNRAWNNSDDGYDLYRAGNSVRIERCYAFRNGENIWQHPFFRGNANGFKLGAGEARHVLIGCLAWGHGFSGFNLRSKVSSGGVILRNCIALDNHPNYWFISQFEGNEFSVFRNNVSHAGKKRDDFVRGVDSQYNNWDTGLTLTDSDFLSLDDSVMTAPRNPDGSIPENDFLKLSPNSKAIDKGVDVNMPYAGKAPDLGAFEYRPTSKQPYVKMLHQYVRDHDIPKVKELLEKEEDVNAKDWLGYAPLHWAIYFGYSDIAEMLISKGANPNLTSDTGRTPLEIAGAMDYGDLVELLKKQGAKE